MAWTAEQQHNAQVIINVGHRLGASQRDIQIALMAAITESSLHNYSGGNADSVGLFQQRAAWGSYAQRHDPALAAAMFFQGGHGGQRGLFSFSARNQMTMGQAAQAVQVSAFPDRYAQHTADAGGLLGTGTGGMGAMGTVSDGSNAASDFGQNKADAASVFDATTQNDGKPTWMQPAVKQTGTGNSMIDEPKNVTNPAFDDSAFTFRTNSDGTLDLSSVGGGPTGNTAAGWRGRAAKIAHQYLGTPYVWGATGPNAFDCSGFVQYVYRQMGIQLPRISYQQANYGKHIGLNDLRVGDLVAWDNSSRNNGADHIAIYIGNGRIIEAPRPGLSVQVSELYDQNQAWGVRMHR